MMDFFKPKKKVSLKKKEQKTELKEELQDELKKSDEGALDTPVSSFDKQASPKKSRKRVIIDESDEETLPKEEPKSPRSSSPSKKKLKAAFQNFEDGASEESERPTSPKSTTETSTLEDSEKKMILEDSEKETTPEEPESPKKTKKNKKSTEQKSTESQKSIPKFALLPDNSIPYEMLVQGFEEIEENSSRLKIISLACEIFLNTLRLKPEELTTIVYLCINRLGPEYDGLELGLGESIIIKALGESTGRSNTQIKAEYRTEGDLGLVALKLRKTQPTMFQPKPLSIETVFKGLHEIAITTGKDSQGRKIAIIKRLLTAAKGFQAKFIVRSLEGKLRIGLAEKSVLTGLAQAFVSWEYEKAKAVSSKHVERPDSQTVTKAEDLIREVHCQVPNYGTIIDAAIAGGIFNIAETCKLSAGVPLKPMLAKPTKSITEILDRFNGEEFTCEYKYDGERAQVHQTEDGKLHVYSRNMEDMSQRYPDILSSIAQFANKDNTTSYILDCEAVAWDRAESKLLPFQVLSTRKRKDVDEDKITVRICLFAFDLLYLNGQPLLNKTLEERRELLQQHFTPLEGHFAFAKSINSNNVEDIQTFLDQSVKDSCEGLMIKVLKGNESGYEPSKRSRNWLKLKKDYLQGVGDSLDLAVLGAYYGKGKRTNRYGAFLLGCYNSDTEQYETICKIGTGFSDENLEEFYKALSATVIEKPKGYYSYDTASNNQPDVWFQPTMIWEVLTADLSLSPVYKAGIDTLGKGISLRFPRFIRVRDDKGIEDVTTSDQVVEFYRRQASVGQNNDSPSDDE